MEEFADLKVRHPIFAINLRHRTDRRFHITQQFSGLTEFDFDVFEACENVVGAVGLWQSIVNIVRIAQQRGREYVIICEDDHEFTPDFDADLLSKSIGEGRALGADVVLGGASAIYSCCRVSSNLIWMESFTGTQFVIVFAKFYEKILNCEFTSFDSADFKFTALTNDIYCIFPFISIQKEFGYSDVTASNSEHGRLPKLFSQASGAVQFCLERFRFFQSICSEYNEGFAPDDVSLCTYIVESGMAGGTAIQDVIEGMWEFNVVGSYSTEDGVTGLNSICVLQKAVRAAIAADEDFVVVIDSEHSFSRSYSKELLVGGILDANQFGADFLLGGTQGGFTHTLPATARCFWINDFRSTHFIVLFRKFFDKILSYEINEQSALDGNILATLTSNAFLVFPFLSNAVSNTANTPRGVFDATEARMCHVRKAFAQYGQVCIE